MRLASKEDISAPIEQVFARLSDFDSYERQALRRGADVTRKDNLTAPGVGMIWDIGFNLRGKARRVELTLDKYVPPTNMAFSIKTTGLEGAFFVELVELSKYHTRMQVELDIRARSLSARLLIQSLKLARGNLGQRFATRVKDFAKDIERSCPVV